MPTELKHGKRVLIEMERELVKREWLIEARKARGLTTYSAAERIGIPQSTYAQIETGRRNPSISLAKKIANSLLFDWTVFFRDVA